MEFIAYDVEQIKENFQQLFGAEPLLVRSPGRINIIGEHTDYNDGFVMPLAVDRAVWMAVAPRNDKQISVQTLDFGSEQITFSLPAACPSRSSLPFDRLQVLVEVCSPSPLSISRTTIFPRHP